MFVPRISVVLGLGCCAAIACTPGVTPTPKPPVEATPEAGPATPPAPVVLDGKRLTADIDFLASDAMRGRFTLSPELASAAEFLAGRHRELGLVPLASSFQVNFPIVVGVRPTQPVALRVTRAAKSAEVSTGEASVVPRTGLGEVRGPAVFVGYAAQSEPARPAEPGAAPAEPGAAAPPPTYNDLDGLDLKGKIAVVLLDAPRRPDPMTFFRWLGDEQRAFASAAAPLKKTADTKGLVALHERTRARLLRTLQPFLVGADLKGFWPAPADPLTLEFEPQRLLSEVFKAASQVAGPSFNVFTEGSLATKVERLVKAGAVGVVVVRGPRSFLSDEDRDADAFVPLQAEDSAVGEPFPVPVLQLKWKAADKLLRVGKRKISELQAAIDTAHKPQSGEISGAVLELSAQVQRVEVQVPNIVASIPGTDLAGEYVVLGAHYDHIGVPGRGECREAVREGVADAICNGADDNASGTAVLLELARRFQAERPRRTVVFAHFAGEEMGLLGSKALAERPPFPIDKVVAMINLDMIGRLGPKGLAIGGIVSSDAWMPLLDKVGPRGLSVLYEASVATRSDHASFYRKRVPVLFFFTGTHADYHRPGDEAGKINLEGLVTIGGIVHDVTRAVADGLPVPYKEPPEGGGLAGGLPGSNPETVVKRVLAKE